VSGDRDRGMGWRRASQLLKSLGNHGKSWKKGKSETLYASFWL